MAAAGEILLWCRKGAISLPLSTSSSLHLSHASKSLPLIARGCRQASNSTTGATSDDNGGRSLSSAQPSPASKTIRPLLKRLFEFDRPGRHNEVRRQVHVHANVLFSCETDKPQSA